MYFIQAEIEANKTIQLVYCQTLKMVADIPTKALPYALFAKFASALTGKIFPEKEMLRKWISASQKKSLSRRKWLNSQRKHQKRINLLCFYELTKIGLTCVFFQINLRINLLFIAERSWIQREKNENSCLCNEQYLIRIRQYW